MLAARPTFLRGCLSLFVACTCLAVFAQDKSGPAPPAVAPSIDPELAAHTRLFEKQVYQVGDRVYSANGYSISNIVMIEGDDGLVVVDTGIDVIQARAVLKEFRKLSPKPIVAIVYTHHHADHVQGTTAFATADDVKSGKVPIYAHASLLDEYEQESGLIGPIMSARALAMYNLLLKKDELAGMNVGVGPLFRPGPSGFIPPTKTFAERLDVTLAGVPVKMFYVPSEADSEIAIYLPEDKILLAADVIQGPTFPNLYTLRGAKFRDPRRWYESIDLMRLVAADAQHMVSHHAPPVSGRDQVREVLQHYRDAIQYVHDQTVRHINQGLAKDEIAKRVKLPPHLASYSPWLRPFYGTVQHSAPEIFTGYVGWFDGDPTQLDPTPRAEQARRLVELMGGRDKVLAAAQEALDKGDSQFSAELTTYLIRVDLNDMDARRLKATAFRKLGFAQINPTWRGFYLLGAHVLDGTLKPDLVYNQAGAALISPETLSRFPARSQIDALPPRLKAEETLDLVAALGVEFTDVDEAFTITIRRGIAHVQTGLVDERIATLHGDRAAIGPLLAGVDVKKSLANKGLKIDGEPKQVQAFLAHFETPFRVWPNYFLR